MKAATTIKYALPSQTYSAGARTSQRLGDLPPMLLGQLCHVSKVDYEFTLTPTFTTSPTEVGDNNFFASMDVYDGRMVRFVGGANHLRAQERLTCGRNRQPDPNRNASTVARSFGRSWSVGPRHFEGSPSDFAIPVGALLGGEIRFLHAALTDFSADTTAATGSVRLTANLILADEIRIPPAYQFINQSLGAADVQIAGRAAYESVALLNSASFDGFTAGGLGNLNLDLGKGDVVIGVNAQALARSFQDDMAAGDIGNFVGDPAHATNDSAARQVNRASATALAIGAEDLQPVLWASESARIAKLPVCEGIARLRWSGTATSAVALVGRILPQSATQVAAIAAQAILRIPGAKVKSLDIKTLSKKAYPKDGPYGEFLPWVAKLA